MAAIVLVPERIHQLEGVPKWYMVQGSDTTMMPMAMFLSGQQLFLLIAK